MAKTAKRAGKRIALAVDRHLPLFHGFQKRRLRAGRHAVDLVDQQQIGEDRPAMQPERRRGRLKNISAQDIGGNQIRRALHALKLQPKQMRQALHRQRLGQPRDALDERVAAREHDD